MLLVDNVRNKEHIPHPGIQVRMDGLPTKEAITKEVMKDTLMTDDLDC
jgi:hypothetical protein